MKNEEMSKEFAKGLMGCISIVFGLTAIIAWYYIIYNVLQAINANDMIWVAF